MVYGLLQSLVCLLEQHECIFSPLFHLCLPHLELLYGLVNDLEFFNCFLNFHNIRGDAFGYGLIVSQGVSYGLKLIPDDR